jgi:maleate cis-trans isomerase
MEPDFHQHLAESTVSTTRILLEQVTRDAEIRMLEEDLPQAAQLIRTTAPDVIVFGCSNRQACVEGSSNHQFANAGSGR